ncbi:MAG: hypothetical protein D6699_00870, partial [Aquificota bacterium]
RITISNRLGSLGSHVVLAVEQGRVRQRLIWRVLESLEHQGSEFDNNALNLTFSENNLHLKGVPP